MTDYFEFLIVLLFKYTGPLCVKLKEIGERTPAIGELAKQLCHSIRTSIGFLFVYSLKCTGSDTAYPIQDY